MSEAGRASDFDVEYVYLDEATPRDVHTTTVKAADEEEAKLLVWTALQLGGDRVSVTHVLPAVIR